MPSISRRKVRRPDAQHPSIQTYYEEAPFEGWSFRKAQHKSRAEGLPAVAGGKAYEMPRSSPSRFLPGIAAYRKAIAQTWLASEVCHLANFNRARVATASCKYILAEEVDAHLPRSSVRSMLWCSRKSHVAPPPCAENRH